MTALSLEFNAARRSVEWERPLGRLMRYGIPLPQTPTAQEGSLEKSEQNRKLALDRLARIDDQYRRTEDGAFEGISVPRLT